MSQTLKPARYWIETLRLEPHPEGGHFRQTYRAERDIASEALPGFSGARAASTAIYFLLEAGNFSAFHRLKSDEVWHFYLGTVVAVHVISTAGEYSKIRLGNDLDNGEVLQEVVKAGCWFASEVESAGGFALVGCTVAPGFDFDDFEMGNRAELVQRFPACEPIIRRLTRAVTDQTLRGNLPCESARVMPVKYPQMAVRAAPDRV